MDIRATAIACEKCGRTYRAVFTCPMRSNGCDYVVLEQTRNHEILIVGFVLAFLAFVLLGVTNSWAKSWLLLPVLGIASALWWSLMTVRLHNTKQFTRLERTTLAGIELRLERISAGQALSVGWHTREYPEYPFSICALAAQTKGLNMNEKAAGGIFCAALLGLISSGTIGISVFQGDLYRRWLGPKVKYYFIVVLKDASHNSYAGSLEGKIVEVLTKWDTRSRRWPEGPPIYDLVRAVYGHDVSAPQKWLARMVAEDAATRGLCRITKRLLRRRVEWYEGSTGPLMTCHQACQAISARLQRVYPDYAKRIDEEITKAIGSRQQSDNTPSVEV